MISINREGTRYKCPECGRAVTVRPMCDECLVKRPGNNHKLRNKTKHSNEVHRIAETPRKAGKFDIDQYREMRNQNMSLCDIAIEMGISYEALCKHRKLNGIKRDRIKRGEM